MTIKFLSLFSGIGAGDLGLEDAGLECVGQVEIDKQCQSVLRRHWPRVPLFDDVRKVRAALEPRNAGRSSIEFPKPDWIVGGFPCQDISVAGKRAGLSGERSGLWWEFRRIVALLRPRGVLIENVDGLRSSNGGRDLGAILGALVDLGYGWPTGALTLNTSVCPKGASVCSLSDILETQPVHPKYFLSPTACRGILRRAAGRVGELVPDTSFAITGKQGRRQNVELTTLIPFAVHGEHSNAMTGQGQAQVAEPADVSRALDSTGGYTKGQGGNVITYALQEGIERDQNLKSGPQGKGWQEGVAFTLESRHHSQAVAQCESPSSGVPFVNIDYRTSDWRQLETSGAVTAGEDRSKAAPIVLESEEPELRQGPAVRRLTPVECARLQGMPDDHCAVGADGETISDSAQYRMYGNAITRNVARWLGSRINLIDGAQA